MTSAEINALPRPVRDYIHALETNCDPAGLVRANESLREQVHALTKMGEELKAQAAVVSSRSRSRNATSARAISPVG